MKHPATGENLVDLILEFQGKPLFHVNLPRICPVEAMKTCINQLESVQNQNSYDHTGDIQSLQDTLVDTRTLSHNGAT